MKKTIIVRSKATMSAEGKRNNRNCKPVFCKTTGQVWTSAVDAGDEEGVSESTISLCCTGKQKGTNGKTFCYVEDMPEHYEDIARIIQMMYPDWIEGEKRRAEERRLEAERKLEEKRLAEEQKRIDKAKANYAKWIAKHNKTLNGLEEARAELYALGVTTM